MWTGLTPCQVAQPVSRAGAPPRIWVRITDAQPSALLTTARHFPQTLPVIRQAFVVLL